MATQVVISMASADDAQALGEVMVRAMEPHMIDRFFSPEEDFRLAYEGKMKWFLGSYSDSIKDPTKRVFKATSKETGEIVGIGAIQYYGADAKYAPMMEKEEMAPLSGTLLPEPVIASLPAEKKSGFAEYYFGRSAGFHAKHMAGIKHVVWTTLHVKPSFQGKGVGSALLRWGFREFELERELVWISTQMRGRNIYRRFGWEDKDHFDVDLSDWGGKLRGFGIHRTPYLLRQPGEFKKLDGFTDE